MARELQNPQVLRKPQSLVTLTAKNEDAALTWNNLLYCTYIF